MHHPLLNPQSIEPANKSGTGRASNAESVRDLTQEYHNDGNVVL